MYSGLYTSFKHTNVPYQILFADLLRVVFGQAIRANTLRSVFNQVSTTALLIFFKEVLILIYVSMK